MMNEDSDATATSETSEEEGQVDELAGQGAVDLTRVRELVLAAHPDVVPELVQGDTFDDLISSIEPARDAYQRIASEAAATRSTPNVAAQPGQRGTHLVDVESLSPLAKISEGLRRQ
jgi:hypothetical protein